MGTLSTQSLAVSYAITIDEIVARHFLLSFNVQFVQLKRTGEATTDKR
jgi:hypothetical protein